MKAAAILLVAAAACRRGHPPEPVVTDPPRPTDLVELYRMRGAWTWIHTSTVDGTMRLERERWLIDGIERQPDGHEALIGRYRRDLVVFSVDGSPFVCSQQAAYTQIAVFDVRVTAHQDEVSIEETAYRTMPSPCEPGFRKLGRYVATFTEDLRPVLSWDGGSQALTSYGAVPYRPAAVDLPALPDGPGGAWRWAMRSRDEEGDVRDEDERWELAVGDDGAIGGTYLRSVMVSSGDGRVLPCAGATSYGFLDRYTVRGVVDGDSLRFDEIAVEPGTHPCLAGTPERRLDSASGRVDGGFLVLTWRGQRRQVLHR